MPLQRRQAYFFGVQLQVRRLTSQAARSAAQTSLIRHSGTTREHWEALVPTLVDALTQDTETRVRRAREAGAAPLDLANGAALVGLGLFAEEMLLSPWPIVQRRELAEMLDRMWDTMAHEVPRDLERRLGGNPRLLRRLPRT